jgi:4-hydroxy-tetrahydrodipicolinate reductase
MKIALLGSGKTGHKVIALVKSPVTIFNSKNPPSVENLKGHDIVISFLPGDIFLSYVDTLIESQLPVVTGATGFRWSEALKSKLYENNVKWIWASNFSLGMIIVKNMIRELSKAGDLFDDYDFNIHEQHHVQKVDAPSGTALSWKAWLNESKEIGMSYERQGDTIGLHEMTLSTPHEEIKLSHTAKDRSLFAKGALWAASKLLNDISFPVGLTLFSDLVEKNLNELINYKGNDER